MTTFWGKAAPSANHMFSLYHVYLLLLLQILLILFRGIWFWFCQFLVIAYVLLLNLIDVALRLLYPLPQKRVNQALEKIRLLWKTTHLGIQKYAENVIAKDKIFYLKSFLLYRIRLNVKFGLCLSSNVDYCRLCLLHMK